MAVPGIARWATLVLGVLSLAAAPQAAQEPTDDYYSEEANDIAASKGSAT